MSAQTDDAAGGTPEASGTPGPIRLALCPYGTFHLTLGGVTLHLTEEELAMLGRAIHVMAGRHPTLLQRLIARTLVSAPDNTLPPTLPDVSD
jgi:hypothetical protein